MELRADTSEAEFIGQTVRVECDVTKTVAYINHPGGPLQISESGDGSSLRFGDHFGHCASSDPPTGSGQRPGELLVPDLSGFHQLVTGQGDCEDPVEMWGIHHLDVFASPLHSHLSVWFSRTPHPEAAACDALIHPWIGPVPVRLPSFFILRMVLSRSRRTGQKQ